MVKTQVQIPDHLFREAKRIAEEYELSFAEVVRRGLERLAPSYPPRAGAGGGGELPELELGLIEDPFAETEWRAELWTRAEEVAEEARPEPPRAGRRPKRTGAPAGTGRGRRGRR